MERYKFSLVSDFAVASLLVAGLAVGQWLHGGLMEPAMAWPLFVCACAAAMLAAFSDLSEKRLPEGVWGAAGLFVLAGFGVVRWAQNDFPASGFLPSANLVAGFFGCVAILFGLRGRKVRLFFVVGVVVLGLAQLLQMMAWRVGGGGVELVWYSDTLRAWYESRFNPRESGFFLNHNEVVWVLNTGCIFCASLSIWGRLPSFVKFLFGWGSGFFALGALLTLSRGGAVGLGAGLLFFLLLSLFVLVRTRARGKYRGGVLVLLVALICGLSLGGLYLVGSNLLVQERLEMVAEDDFRMVTWKSGVRQFQMEPAVGTGPGSGGDYARFFRSPRSGPSEPVYLHNDWLQLFAEGGVVAGSLVLLALVLFFGSGLRVVDARLQAMRKEDFPQSTEVAICIGSLSCLAVYAAHSFFDFNMQLAANSFLAFCVLGLSAGVGLKVESEEGEKGGGWAVLRRLGIGVFVFVSGASALYFSAPFFFDEVRRTQIQNAVGSGNMKRAQDFADEEVVQVSRNGNLQMAVGEMWLERARRTRNSDKKKEALGQAIWCFEQASWLLPGDRYPLLRLASAQSQAGRHQEAYANALDGVLLDPFSAMPYEYLGGIADAAGEFNFANRIYHLSLSVAGCSAFPLQKIEWLQKRERAGSVPRIGPVEQGVFQD